MRFNYVQRIVYNGEEADATRLRTTETSMIVPTGGV